MVGVARESKSSLADRELRRRGVFSVSLLLLDSLLLRVRAPFRQGTKPLVCDHSDAHDGLLYGRRRLVFGSDATPLWARSRTKNRADGRDGPKRILAWAWTDVEGAGRNCLLVRALDGRSG